MFLYLSVFDALTKNNMNEESSAKPLSKVEEIELPKSYNTSRLWTPLQLHNSSYDFIMSERGQTSSKNFLKENIVRVKLCIYFMCLEPLLLKYKLWK